MDTHKFVSDPSTPLCLIQGGDQGDGHDGRYTASINVKSMRYRRTSVQEVRSSLIGALNAVGPDKQPSSVRF